MPTLEQVGHVLDAMPTATVLDRRDRALVAFAAITGAWVMALATFRLGHVILDGGLVEQDARTVATKFAKTFCTIFLPVYEGALANRGRMGGCGRALEEAWRGELRFGES